MRYKSNTVIVATVIAFFAILFAGLAVIFMASEKYSDTSEDVEDTVVFKAQPIKSIAFSDAQLTIDTLTVVCNSCKLKAVFHSIYDNPLDAPSYISVSADTLLVSYLKDDENSDKYNSQNLTIYLPDSNLKEIFVHGGSEFNVDKVIIRDLKSNADLNIYVQTQLSEYNNTQLQLTNCELNKLTTRNFNTVDLSGKVSDFEIFSGGDFLMHIAEDSYCGKLNFSTATKTSIEFYGKRPEQIETAVSCDGRIAVFPEVRNYDDLDDVVEDAVYEVVD